MSEGRIKSFKNKGKDAAVSYRPVFSYSFVSPLTVITDDGTVSYYTFSVLASTRVSFSQIFRRRC